MNRIVNFGRNIFGKTPIPNTTLEYIVTSGNAFFKERFSEQVRIHCKVEKQFLGKITFDKFIKNTLRSENIFRKVSFQNNLMNPIIRSMNFFEKSFSYTKLMDCIVRFRKHFLGKSRLICSWLLEKVRLSKSCIWDERPIQDPKVCLFIFVIGIAGSTNALYKNEFNKKTWKIEICLWFPKMGFAKKSKKPEVQFWK